MTPGLSLVCFCVCTFFAALFAVICHQIGRLSGGTIKFLEESEHPIEGLDRVFPLQEGYIFAARLVVLGFLILAAYCNAKWASQGHAHYAWLLPLLAGVFYGALELAMSALTARASARFVMVFVPLLKIAYCVLFPLTMPYRAMQRHLDAKRQINEDGETEPSVEDEILSLVESEDGKDSTAMQALEEDEKRMIRGALELDELSVRKIMTPRVDVISVEYKEDMALEDFVNEVRRTIIQSGHSRIPVYSGTIDNIIGIVYSKDLLDERKLSVFDSFVRKKLIVIPVSKNIGDLLEEFRQSKIHLAIVVDEYGGTAGIVTFEDVLETLVGDIQDEYDYAEGEDALQEIKQGVWQCDAKTPVGIVNKVMGVEIPEDEEYDTIGGYLSFVAGHIPAQDESIETPELIALVSKANNRRAIEVQLSHLDVKQKETQE
ncbi:MAG: CBS domain-containing protein [Victivallales bacterium]|nr:CBS domain-containing protein [Victivallales bacterium]